MSNQAITLANLRESFKTKLNEDNSFNNLLAKLEVKTKVNREYIAYGNRRIFIYIYIHLFI